MAPVVDRRQQSESNGVTVGEIRAWLQSEITRMKSDIENLYSRSAALTSRMDVTQAKVLDISPIVDRLRDRLAIVEAKVENWPEVDEANSVTAVAFSEYKREVDNKLVSVRDAVTLAIDTKLKPLSDGIAKDREELQTLKQQINGLMIKWSIALAIACFVAAKAVDIAAKIWKP